MGDTFGEETEEVPCAAMLTRPGPVPGCVCVHAVAWRRSRGNQASRELSGKYSGPWRAKKEKPCPESHVTPEVFSLSCSPLDVVTERILETE